MTTMITNKLTAKAAALVAVVGLVASSFVALAPGVKAMTAAEISAQIAALQAQLAALGGTNTNATFTMNLTIGSSGAEVTALQNWLISKGYSIPAGATGYFGVQTQTALASFQAANGIAPAAGYFGPVTRAKVNAMATPGTGGNNGGSTGSDSALKGGEASLERLRASDGEDNEVEEGGTAEVAEFEFRVEDGDVRVNRLDLTFSPNVGNDEDEPWKAFESVRILADGKEIAEADVSDEDDWLRDDAPYVFRFANLNHIVREGKTATLVVEVEAKDGVVDAGNTDAWTVYINTDGLRAVDGEGIQQYLGNASEDVTFDLVEEGDGEALKVRTSDENPDATTLKIEDDKRSDWLTVLAFDLEAEEGDIELDRLPIDFTTGTADVDDVIDSVRVKVDGKTFTRFDWNGTGAFASTTFDIDGDATIDEDDRSTVEVEVRFKAGNGVNYALGETIRASVKGAEIQAEGADDLVGEGNVTGETHTLQVSGISVERSDRTAEARSTDGADNDLGIFTIEVKVTAFDQDVFIPTIGNQAFTYRIENASDGTTLGSGTATSSTISSNASTQGGYYRINEGQTKNFTFRVVLDPEAADENQSYRLQLLSVMFADTASAPDQSWTALPENVYETQPAYIAD